MKAGPRTARGPVNATLPAFNATGSVPDTLNADRSSVPQECMRPVLI